jgi:lipid II:glycine glycyltransferase (peptidoglycan interpeptide bridge formation enzyme)
MRVTKVTRKDAAEYDRFVEQAEGGHFAQTRAWARVVRAAGPLRVQHYLVRDGARVLGAAAIQRPLLLPVGKLERGPVCASPEDVGPVVRALWKQLFHLRLSVMPYWSGERAARVANALSAAGFRDVQALDGAHAATLRVSLAGAAIEDALAGGEREMLRRKLKQAKKARAVARPSDDVAPLHELYQAMMAAQGKRGRPRSWFEALLANPRARLFVCEHEGRVVSALIAVRHGKLATFLAGATSQDKAPFGKMVPAMVEAMRWAKENGCAAFDMGGVPLAEDTDPKRAQIAQFKHDFSKESVPLVREHARVLLVP